MMGTESLVLAAEAQSLAAPSFFPGWASDQFEMLEGATHGHDFTGQRLFERDPEKYSVVISLIAEGTVPDAYIAKLCGVSRNTVNGVREREKIPVEQEKERILKNVRTGLRMVTERIVELAPGMSARDAIIAAGVLAEKMQLLSGEATAIIITAGEKVKHQDFNSLIDALPAADATVIEMGYPGGMAEQRGGALAGGGSGLAGGGAGAGGDGLLGGAAGDDQSPVQQSECLPSNVLGNGTGANEAAAPGGGGSEGGGGSAADGGLGNPD